MRTPANQQSLREHQARKASMLSAKIALERREERNNKNRPSLLRRLFGSKKSLKQRNKEYSDDESGEESGGGKKGRKIKTRRTRRKMKTHRKKTYRKRK